MGKSDKLAAALEEAKKNPARGESGKSLVSLIIENWNDIQRSRVIGVTYKQIAKNMEVDYKVFLTSVSRAKKKIESNPELIKQNSVIISDTKNDSQEQPTPKSINTTGDNQKRTGPKIIGTKTSSAFEENLQLKHLNTSPDDE